MRPLPAAHFTRCAYRSSTRVPDNYHLEYDGRYCPVSYTMLGKPAILKATVGEARICDERNKLPCVHPRAYERLPLCIADDSHMPPEHAFAKAANIHAPSIEP